MVHQTSGVTLTKSRCRVPDERLRLAVREEVGVDKIVDDGLTGWIDLFELNAHADAAVAPGDTAFGVDIALRSGHPEPHLDLRGGLQRAGGADRDAAATQVEREGRRDHVSETVLDRNP